MAMLSKAKVASEADVSEATVSRAIERGELRAVKEPRRVLVDDADADAWIRSRRHPMRPMGRTEREQGA